MKPYDCFLWGIESISVNHCDWIESVSYTWKPDQLNLWKDDSFYELDHSLIWHINYSFNNLNFSGRNNKFSLTATESSGELYLKTGSVQFVKESFKLVLWSGSFMDLTQKIDLFTNFNFSASSKINSAWLTLNWC